MEEVETGEEKFVHLRLKVETKRKSKTRKSIVEENTFTFEIWDSAAKFLLQFHQVGDRLLVKATAKSRGSTTFFRIDEFFSL